MLQELIQDLLDKLRIMQNLTTAEWKIVSKVEKFHSNLQYAMLLLLYAIAKLSKKLDLKEQNCRLTHISIELMKFS